MYGYMVNTLQTFAINRLIWPEVSILGLRKFLFRLQGLVFSLENICFIFVFEVNMSSGRVRARFNIDYRGERHFSCCLAAKIQLR